MNYVAKGSLIHRLAPVSGQSLKGDWRKQDFVIQTLEARNPKAIAFTAWNDLLDDLRKLRQNDVIIVTFRADSTQHNDRWFTQLRALSIEPDGPAIPNKPTQAVHTNPKRSGDRQDYGYADEEYGDEPY